MTNLEYSRMSDEQKIAGIKGWIDKHQIEIELSEICSDSSPAIYTVIDELHSLWHNLDNPDLRDSVKSMIPDIAVGLIQIANTIEKKLNATSYDPIPSGTDLNQLAGCGVYSSGDTPHIELQVEYIDIERYKDFALLKCADLLDAVLVETFPKEVRILLKSVRLSRILRLFMASEDRCNSGEKSVQSDSCSK